MSITRFSLDKKAPGMFKSGASQSGGWVKYSDHIAEVELSRRRVLEEAAALCEHLWTRAGTADECADAIRGLKVGSDTLKGE
jgi:hypothetical protein